VALTGKGRAALGAYIQALRDLLGGLAGDGMAVEVGSDQVVF
jgi:hypothetical protein